eukprot:2934910-Prymnesium_polylepis.1
MSIVGLRAALLARRLVLCAASLESLGLHCQDERKARHQTFDNTIAMRTHSISAGSKVAATTSACGLSASVRADRGAGDRTPNLRQHKVVEKQAPT